MEISNKAFAVVCVAIVAVTVYVRAQSVHSTVQPTAVVAKAETVVEAPKKHRPIPNAVMPPDINAGSNGDQIVDEAPIVINDLPETSATGTASPAAAKPMTGQAGETAQTGTADEDLTNLDDLGEMANSAPTDNSVELTDRDMLRIMFSSMSNEQRDSFRMMWFSMSPDDRQDFLDQLRGSQPGG